MVNIVQMSGRLQIIEQKLVSINDAEFQNLCDVYLNLRDNQVQSINRTGSQVGKKKTVKGTPDTFFRSESGHLYFVEFTTVANKGIVKKLKDDILVCLDSKVVKINNEKINKIILFFNCKLKVDQEESVIEFSRTHNIDIELIGLDKLALDIFTEHHIIAKEILGIPFETGQILPINNFIEEYNNKAGNLSTPLDNPFLGRVTELEQVRISLESKDLVVLSGPAGVGKTKFGLEVINQFLSENPDYRSYAIVKKDIDIWEDLIIHLNSKKNYILLIDDANRQLLNFSQIMNVFREKRKGNIKLVITVRNHALPDIYTIYDNFEPRIIELSKFSDDEIKSIISNDYFQVKHSRYQNKIIALADGNSRLAVMAAKLAREKHYEFLKGGVYQLYDIYFRTFLKDFSMFDNTAMLKTIGIVSFFFTLRRDDKLFLEQLLKNFDLNYYEFQESLDELSKRELIEISGDNVRISEQVMSTYFFYKIFIKDKKLSFNKLLFGYLDDFSHRFADTVIISNNTFGYTEVFDRIKDDLNQYFFTFQNDNERIVRFIKLFWFYKREETLACIYKKVSQIEESENPVYNAIYDTNDFVFADDKLLALLTPFFRSYAEDSFNAAVELSFEYTRKSPSVFPELIRRLKENTSFEDDDEFNNNFEKQRELSKLLIAKSKEELPHYQEAFLGLATLFLKHTNRVFKTSRKNNAFIHYNYMVPLNEKVKCMKIEVWNYLFELFAKFPQRVLKIINDWKPHYTEVNKKTLALDLPLILGFIEEKLKPKKFEDVYFVQQFLDSLRFIKPRNIKYQHLYNRFINDEFVDYSKVEWTRRFRTKNRKIDHNEYRKLKIKEITTHFVFKDKSEFGRFGKLIKNTLLVSPHNHSNFNSLCIIIENTFKRNKVLGFEMLKYFIRNKSCTNTSVPYNVFSLIANDSDYGLVLWKFLKRLQHKNSNRFRLSFFEQLNDESVNDYYTKEFYNTTKYLDSPEYFNFSWLHKFGPYSQTIFSDFLKIIYDKKLQGIDIYIDDDFFEHCITQLETDRDLVEKLYMQEGSSKQRTDFDYERKGLKLILSFNKNFIFEFVTLFYFNERLMNVNMENLNFIWNFLDENDMEKLFFDIIANSVQIGIGDDEFDMFFQDLSGTKKELALQFLKNMIVKWPKNISSVNCIIRLVRKYFSDQFETFLFLFLENNIDIEDFSSISWNGIGGSYSGNIIVGNIRANEWRSIFEILNKGKSQLHLIPIKNYVKQKIDNSLEYAEYERLRRFINPIYW